MLLALALALAQDPPVTARGASLFANSCGIGYCHGKAGAASRGPRLAGRKFDREYLFRVIAEGAGSGNMPAFAKQYSKTDLEALVVYILSLSGSPAAAVAATAPPSTDQDEFAAGRAVFAERCAGCHRFQGKGGEVGPDLSGQAGRPAKEIVRDIVEPDARGSVRQVAVLTKSGERVVGIRKQETAELVRVWDTAGAPPVLRTIYKDQIQSIGSAPGFGMPAGFGRTLSRRQLLDLVAFLRSAPVAPDEL